MDELEQMAKAMWESDVGYRELDGAGRKTRPTWEFIPRGDGPFAYWMRKAEIARQSLRAARKGEPTSDELEMRVMFK